MTFRLDDYREPPTLELVREQAVAEEIRTFGAAGKYSNLYNSLNAISQAALAHARANGVTDARAFRELMMPGFEVIHTLRRGVIKDTAPDEEQVNFWYHHDDLFSRVRAKNPLPLYANSIESATGKYLKLPYREQSIDRLLADALVAVETSAYADQMWNEKTLFLPPSSPVLRTHPFWPYLKGLGSNLLLGIVVVGIMVALYVYGWVTQGWAIGISLVGIGIAVLSCVLMTIGLPFIWRKHVRERAQVITMMTEMNETYSELRSAGPVSARRLLERMSQASEKGVAWPGSLYALLDDVMAGSGRL